MAALSSNKIAWKYTTGTKEYVLFAQKAITDQAGKVGGEAAEGTEELAPRGFKFRRANVASAAGAKRAVVCYDTSCVLWTTPGITINLNYLNESTVFTGAGEDGQRLESKPRRAVPHDAT